MISMFNSNTVLQTINKNLQQVSKLVDNFATIQEIDVGLTPKKLVLEGRMFKLYQYELEKKSCEIPVLIVYALINKEYILDLEPNRSFIGGLLRHGIEVYLIAWKPPKPKDRYVTLEDYILNYIDECVDYVRSVSGKDKINLLGICQGGLFSVIYCTLLQHKIKNLVTVVTPVNFSSSEGLLFLWSNNMNIEKFVEYYGNIPGDLLNISFLMLSPFSRFLRIMDMLNISEDKEKLLNFLRMEQWIADSPSQAGECYKEYMEIIKENKIVNGTFQLGGKPVLLKNITIPLLNVISTRDNIAPPDSTRILNELVSSTDKELFEMESVGHIGVFVSSKAQNVCIPKIADWLKARQ